MRTVWAIAALVVGAAVALAAWPASRTPRPGQPEPARIDERASESPAPVPASAPSPAPAPAPKNPSALDDLLGGSLMPASGPSTAAPAVSVGTPARIERLDDRTIRVDGEFTIRGNGTERDPYLVSWELLSSASRELDAAAGRFVVPGRIADLRGAWVRISGYWAPPLQVFEARELMVMLNKWDGCCIGLPPTPFDSIEATLARPVQVQGKHLFRFGTITGRLEVEPFVAGTFLLGLYRLQDAVLESSS
jgi:hypothetical protein